MLILVKMIKVFLAICPGNKRDRPTLEALILKHVNIGSTIYTDGWRAYMNLGTHGYSWESVNHTGMKV